MKLNKIALGIAVVFFVIWFALFYAIADHPVPDGFFWIPVTLLVAAGLVYWRVPIYQQRNEQRKKGRFWLAVLEGLAVGLLLAVVIVLRPVTPQPGLPAPGVGDFVVLAMITSILGMINTGAIATVTGWLTRNQA